MATSKASKDHNSPGFRYSFLQDWIKYLIKQNKITVKDLNDEDLQAVINEKIENNVSVSPLVQSQTESLY